jgi:hypothetical protein
LEYGSNESNTLLIQKYNGTLECFSLTEYSESLDMIAKKNETFRDRLTLILRKLKSKIIEAV